MRLTTTSRRTSAALAVTASLALVVTGCAGSEPAAAPLAPPVVKADPASAEKKAKKVSPRKQLAKAVRASLAAHTVTFRERIAARYVSVEDAELGRNRNPLQAISGTANFKRNMAVYHLIAGAHSAQPVLTAVTVLVKGRKAFAGATSDVNGGGAWQQGFTGHSVDELVDVLGDVKGKVRLVRENVKSSDGERGMSVYQMRVDVGRSLLDSDVASTRSLGRQLLGKTAVQRVWVGQDGRISKVQGVLESSTMAAAGLDSSEVKAVVVNLRLTNYGVDMVFPPHPTEV